MIFFNMTPDQIKHLEFIQAVITRMNANSFQLKGWSIAIVSALLALYANSNNVIYIFVAIIPTLLFWGLDAYYLQQERKFRGVYNNVSGLKNDTKIQKNLLTLSHPILYFFDLLHDLLFGHIINPWLVSLQADHIG